MAMGHFDGDHGRHDFEHFTAKDASTETQTLRPWSKFCIIEDIVVSYTSKVEVHISRYFYMILRGVFVFGS